MSLKAKLEAVIYAAEEPVTLTQLAQLFAADALEWQAAQAAAALEANAEIAGDSETMPLLDEATASLGVADTAAMIIQAGQQASDADSAIAVQVEFTPESAPEPASEAPEAESGTPAPDAETGAETIDAEAEARRLARQREREIKSILRQILDELIAAYEADDHGLEIREIAGGYRMATKPECHDAVRLFVKSLKPPMKLSLPALETLAVVAYRQPVTAPEVSEIRGVETAGVLGSLLARKLIATAGRKQVIGRPILYKTTKEFLLRFGLKDLAELPSMEEFEKMAAAEIEELEPEAVAADAAEAAAEAALEQAEASEPGAESAAAGQAYAEAEAAADPSEGVPPTDPRESTQASQQSAERPTDATSAEPFPTSNEQDPAAIETSNAPPAEPETPATAEIEADPHAQKVQEEHGV